MRRAVLKFLKENLSPGESILLGLSGGPDSLALLHLLLECRKILSFNLGVAHIDHGWRKESVEEAETLRKMVSRMNLPFHIKELNPGAITGNLENGCREERLLFFSRLCREHSYRAVLLAHQQDDQAETFLKRIFEGSAFAIYSAMKPVTVINGLTIWRPLLDIPKKALLRYLKKKDIPYFDDLTNRDLAMLRARFREKIIPYVARQFGKEITSPLAFLAKEGEELELFLRRKLARELSLIGKGPFGADLDLSFLRIEGEFEVRYLVRKVCRDLGLTLSRSIIVKVAQHMLKGSANKKFIMGNFCLYVDRSRLFITGLPPEGIPERRATLSDKMVIGPWRVSLERSAAPFPPLSGWKNAWQGNLKLFLPAGHDYEIGRVKANIPYPGRSSIDRWWNKHKVPAFLRYSVPAILLNGKVYHEFLSGRSNVCQYRDREYYEGMSIALTPVK